MQCPNCANPVTHKHGDRRRRCPACGKTFTIDKRSDGGRPAIGDTPLTPYEKIKRYRAKKKKTV